MLIARCPAALPLVLAAVLAFAAATASAQPAAATEISIVPKLRAGDEFAIEIARIRENSAAPGQNARATVPVVVRVISAAPHGTIVDWTPGLAVFANRALAANPLVEASQRVMGGLSVRLRLAADGEVAGIENEAEVLAKVQAATKIIVDGALAETPADQRAQMQTLLNQLMTPELLVSSVTREAQMYFGLNGVSLRVGQGATAQLEQPSPFGGTIPATFEVRMESADAATAVVKTSMTYDSDALIKMTTTLLEQTGTKVSQDELAKAAFRMSDEGRYHLDLATGLMREVIVDRRISAEGKQRRDAWEMRLVTGPAR
jgi:hypothetical protein